jgi:hypothetical protein
MSINIACSIPGCTNPVIGQCTGYKKNCGKYYCHEHSLDTLCAECASRKLTDDHAQEVYQDYLRTSEQIEQEALSVFNGKVVYKKGIKVAALVGLIGGPILLPIIASQGFAGTGAVLTDMALGLLAGPIYGIIGWTIYIFPFVWIWGASKRGGWLREQGRQRAIQVDNIKPGFMKFYETWRSDKRKEKLMGVLTTVGVIAVIAIGAAAGSMGSSTDEKIRDHEFKKH